MRALFAFTGGSGHFLPTLPVARALAAAGHEVRYTCQSAMLETVRRAGFEALDSGGRTLAAASARRPLVVADRADEIAVLSTVFAGAVARERAARVCEVARSFRPDVIVRDEVDFGAAVAAELLGLPHAAVTVLASGSMITPGLLDEPLATLCGEVGLSHRSAAFLDRHLTLVPVMPSFQDPASRPLPNALAFRPDVLAGGPAVAGNPEVQRWLAGPRDRPLVYFTLGTVFHQESGDLFPRVLDGLQQLPVDVVVTVGREIDPVELGPRGQHILVERFVPQHQVLPHCRAVVSHAGSGTVVSSLACGVPLVLLPMGADQPFNADRCVALGVGRVLDAVAASPADVRDAVDDVLNTPSYLASAGRLRSEAATLPPAEVAADAVLALVR